MGGSFYVALPMPGIQVHPKGYDNSDRVYGHLDGEYRYEAESDISP